MRALPLTLALAAGSAAAQSSSPGFQMFDPAVAGFGGPSSSAAGATAYAVQPGLGAGGMSSPAFGADPGFLETNEPEYPDGPVIFGSSPGFGVSGATLTVSGVHFDFMGSAPTVQVFVGGVQAGGVSVLSDTLLTCLVPVLPSGLHELTVSTTFGADVRAAAFVAAPALVTPALAVGGGPLTLVDYGPAGGSFLLLWSLSQQSQFLPAYGTLLVGPAFYVLGSLQLYPPDGSHELALEIPDDPVLDGLQIHFQSLSVLPGVSIQLTNASSTELLATG